ncbi:MAG: redoxin domain-containing protein [Actinomycetota bacterium]
MCNREAPSVEEVALRYADQVNFVGVAWTGSEDSFQGFVDRHGLTFPQISDDPGNVFARFDVAFQPALKLVSPDGSIETTGRVDESILEELIANAT